MIFKILKYSSSKCNSHHPSAIFPLHFLTLITTAFIIMIINLTKPVGSILMIDSYEVSALANYTLQILQFSSNAPAGSYIQLQLPAQFSADDLHAHAPYIGNELDGFCPDVCDFVSISYSGRVFKITGMFPTQIFMGFQYTIFNVPNPRIGKNISSPFIITVYDSSGISLYSETTSGVTFTPKNMVCTGTATDFTGINFGATAYFQISPLTNPNDYPLNQIQIAFPSQWTGQSIVSSTLSTSVYCISSSQPSATCTLSSNTVSLSNVSYSSSIDFQIHSLSNPSSTMSAGPVAITTMTKERYKLDACTLNINGFYKDQFRMPSASITYVDQTYMNIQVSITFPMNVASGTVLSFQFPSNLPLTGGTFTAFLAGNLLSNVNPIYHSVNNTVTFAPFNSLISKPSIQLACNQILRPRSAIPISTITASSYYNNNFITSIDILSTILKGRNSLTISQISTNKPYLSTINSTYTFKLETTIEMEVNDIIQIYFPKQYNLTKTNSTQLCSITSSNFTTSLATSPLCIILQSNIIKISSFLTSAFPAYTSLRVELYNISNPSKNPTSSPFSIYTLDSSSYIVQYNNNAYITISAAYINIFSIQTFNSSKILDTNVQYKLNFITNAFLQYNYHVLVTIPIQMNINTRYLSCLINSVTMPCWPSNGIIFIRILSSIATNTIELILNGMSNPQSIQPTTSFTISIQDTQNNVIEQTNPSINANVTMTALQQFKYIWIKYIEQEEINAKGNILNIIVVSRSQIKNNYHLIIKYNPTEIYLQSIAASICSSFISPSISCTVNFNDHIITVTNLSPTSSLSDTLSFNISNVIPIIQQPTLTLTLTNPSNYSILQSNSLISSIVFDIVQYTLLQSSYIYNDVTTFTINYFFTYLPEINNINVSNAEVSYILVYIPQQYTTPYPSNIYNYTDNTTNIQAGIITIANITNPNITFINHHINSKVQYIYLIAYNKFNSIVAVSINNKYYQPYTLCQYPCKQCIATSCLSCYQQTWSTYKLLYTNVTTSITTCLSTCPQYYYLNSTILTCQLCSIWNNTHCTRCNKDQPNQCLQCSATYYLHEVDNKCYNVCPNGYYHTSNGTYCIKCPNPNCNTCSSATSCLSCISSYYLYNSQCISTCPPRTYPSITLPLQCLPCAITNCISCPDISICLACIQTHYLYNNSCYSSCPSPLLPTLSQSGICGQCQCGGTSYCLNYSSYCVSCNQSLSSTKKYLYNHYCYLACPDGYYSDTNNICTKCSSNCLKCSTITLCIICVENYILYKQNATYISCILSSQCNTNATNLNFTLNTTTITLSTSTKVPICEVCTSPCFTCSTSPTFCLSCVSTYKLHQNTCVSSCPSTLYDVGGSCHKCVIECLECANNDPYNCTACVQYFYLYNYTCYSQCPASTYPSLAIKQCLSCNPTCLLCINATNCTACITGFYLYNFYCYDSCPKIPVVFYPYNNMCVVCQPQCTSCINNSPIQCSTCSADIYYYNNGTHICSVVCQTGYFKYINNVTNKKYCVACQSPCYECDSTYNSCKSCSSGYYLYNGTCGSTCPATYYQNDVRNICSKCAYPCQICTKQRCILCEEFAYMYKNNCVLECPEDMPYKRPGYCTECIGVGFCAKCKNEDMKEVCYQCVYPYAMFEGNCLNQCPTNYTIIQKNGVAQCSESQQYLQYLKALQKYNLPFLPPFLFLGLFFLTIIILAPITHKIYRYTYHIGYMVSLLTIFNTALIYYELYYISTRYLGQYIPIAPKLPIAFLIVSIILNCFFLSSTFYLWVLKQVYLKDIRYEEWKERNKKYWIVFNIIMPLIGGPRVYKLNYSKLFGADVFSYRILSVQKFHEENILTCLSAVGDFFELIALVICEYNIFIKYSGILFLGYETFAFKILMWFMILYDMKKPDRGFFVGDQQQAEQAINKEIQEQEKKLNRVDTQNFIKLVRTKSTQQLKVMESIIQPFKDYISVYNPQDYEDVIRVPNKKIEKNIYKGKYRKGRKITIEEKLQRFVDNIKPKPKIGKKVDSYWNGLIYWKPPQQVKVTPKKVVPQSQQSLLALLQQKQKQYKEDLDDIILEQKKQRYIPTKTTRYDPKQLFEDLDQTIPNDIQNDVQNETIEFFYPSRMSKNSFSIESHRQQQQHKNSIQIDDLMNLNYARKKHLEKEQSFMTSHKKQPRRNLYHQPQKKRQTNLKGVGQRIFKNYN